MENNFYVGIVKHEKYGLHKEYSEKVVLYKDGSRYIDLINDRVYENSFGIKDYVLEDTLVPTDVSEHKTDYPYLLNRYKEVGKPRKKKITISSLIKR